MMQHLGNVLRLQIGEAMPFAREQTSAIQKYQVDQVDVTVNGFVGDEQADQFFHGGPIQAVHQMPLGVYALLREHFPKIPIYEGMLGENLIVEHMQEPHVCIGDVMQMGEVQLQITRPRRPCWKIDSLLSQSGVAKFLQDQHCIGWYYRVLQVGHIQRGDACYLLKRDYEFANLERLWQIYNDANFRDAVEIQAWLDIPVLEKSFKTVLAKRLKFK